MEGIQLDERNLKVAVKNIARTLGDDVSEVQVGAYPRHSSRFTGSRGMAMPGISALSRRLLNKPSALHSRRQRRARG